MCQVRPGQQAHEEPAPRGGRRRLLPRVHGRPGVRGCRAVRVAEKNSKKKRAGMSCLKTSLLLDLFGFATHDILKYTQGGVGTGDANEIESNRAPLSLRQTAPGAGTASRATPRRPCSRRSRSRVSRRASAGRRESSRVSRRASARRRDRTQARVVPTPAFRAATASVSLLYACFLFSLSCARASRLAGTSSLFLGLTTKSSK